MGPLKPHLHGDGGFRGVVCVKGQHTAWHTGAAVSEWWFCFLWPGTGHPKGIRVGGVGCVEEGAFPGGWWVDPHEAV